MLIENIEKYIPTPERINNQTGIMHILRSFDINKPGTPIKNIKGGALGGALIQGEFETDSEIEILPGIYNEKKNRYEPIYSKIASLATGAGIVDKVKPGGLVAIGSKLDPSFIKSDSLIGSVIGKPNTLPETVDEIPIDINLFDTAVGTQDLVKVEPIKTKENLRLNIGTAVTTGTVTSSKNQRIEIKIKKPVCLMPKSKVAISRRIADRWRLIGAGTTGINKMNIISDTSFLMILCYEPIKNMNFLEFKVGKPIFLIHPLIIKELTQIKQKGNIKRSKIANLALEIIDKEIINKNFKHLDDNGYYDDDDDDEEEELDVDSHLLLLSIKKKCPLATIDKNLMKRALKNGADIIQL